MVSSRKIIGISVFAFLLWLIVSFLGSYLAKEILKPFGLEFDFFASTLLSALIGMVLVYALFKAKPVFVGRG